jgi:photosystem II stability/assembly factor-like uncharacterized protein
MKNTLRIVCLLVLAGAGTVWAQKKTDVPKPVGTSYPANTFNALEWRSIGPYRGGRSLAVAGHANQPYTYYFGATGGGIWKSDDGGNNWNPIADSFLTMGSVGAIAVAPSDPNVIYAGTGERDIRGNISPGDGIYKSTDAGKTWAHISPKSWRFVGRIVIHPTNPDVAYAAVLGQVFGEPLASEKKERGVYRTQDGGKTWEQVLYKNEKAGAVHIAMDPSNPRTLYAALWECYRNPWSMSSGGEGSGLYKSTDGGATWKDISRNPGLPKGMLGKIGISISPANPQRVYALVEASAGGLFRSDDGGETFTRINEERNLRQRAWYYTHVHADPKNPDVVYVLNVNMLKSVDGGKTFSTIRVRHGDVHDLWIDPNNPQRIIVGDDGGAEVSYNGGLTFTELDLPTAQFYHVITDNGFPYRIYGAQQDNSTICIPSRTTGSGITASDWFPVAGGESGYIAVNPKNYEITYGGSYGGYLTRYDHATDVTTDIHVWPDNPMGAGAGAQRYRWQWTFPIVVSPHNPDMLFATAQHVFRTTNEGKSWERISPDLTRNDTTKLGASGGPLTKDNTGVEYYCTIFAFAESPVQKGVYWAGSDDGLVHVSRDEGKTWNNVTPKALPEWALISIVEPSPFDAGTCYVTATRYKLNDFRPYVFKTTDYGATWTQITTGIADDAFTRVTRCDPARKGLLYCGTEKGMYVSFDDGASWQSLQLNLPPTPIHDLAVQAREKDLVAATHGRSFWVLDDLSPLHQLADDISKKNMHLYAPRHTYRMDGASVKSNQFGQNPPSGVVLYYYLNKAATDTLKLQFYDSRDSLVATFNSKMDLKGTAVEESKDFYPKKNEIKSGVPTARAGMNRFVWDMQWPMATEVEKAVYWGGGLSGPRVVPGNYKVKLTVGKESQTQPLEIRKDPRLAITPDDYTALLELQRKIHRKIDQAHRGINKIRAARKAVNDVLAQLKGSPAHKAVEPEAKPVLDKLTKIENELIQSKSVSSQDPLNYPIRLNDKLVSLLGGLSMGDARPTQQHYQVFDELAAKVDAQLAALEPVLKTDIAKLNELIKAQNVPAIEVKEKK